MTSRQRRSCAAPVHHESIRSSVERVLDRSDRLDSLQCQSESLGEQSACFFNSASKSKKKSSGMGGDGMMAGVGSAIAGTFSNMFSFGSRVSQPAPRASAPVSRSSDANYCFDNSFTSQASCNSPSSSSSFNDPGSAPADDLFAGFTFQPKGSAPPSGGSFSSPSAPPAPAPVSSTAVLDLIVQQQGVNGAMPMSSALTSACGVTADAVQRATGSALPEIVATALAIAYLRLRLAHLMDVWELMADKAFSFLVDQVGLVDATDMVSNVTAIL